MANDENNQVPPEPGDAGRRDRFFDFLQRRAGVPGPDDRPDAVPDCEPSADDDEDPCEWAFFRALGGVPPLCLHCGELCKPHVIAVRDATMARAAHLAARMVGWIKLYFDARQLGQDEPGDTKDQIYELWDELGYLGESVEPQESFLGEDEDEE